MEQQNKFPSLLTIPQFVEKHPFISQAALRNHIFNSDFNKMKEFNVIKKLGKRVYLEENNFFKWLEFKNNESISHG